MTALTVAFWVATYGTLAALSWREFTNWARRHNRTRAELRRCGRVTYPTSAPRFTRDDPSPKPHYDANRRLIREAMLAANPNADDDLRWLMAGTPYESEVERWITEDRGGDVA